ncbi:MAG: hypothetical protein WBD46_04635 [Acidobacteriaceae bacterium]
MRIVYSVSGPPGDRLILVPDGNAEAMDSNGQLFGFERIDKVLALN